MEFLFIGGKKCRKEKLPKINISIFFYSKLESTLVKKECCEIFSYSTFLSRCLKNETYVNQYLLSFGKRCQFQIEVLVGIEVSRNPQRSRLDAIEFQTIKESNKSHH